MAALDRVIRLTYDRGGTTTRGHYTPDNVTETQWARRTDTGADRLLETGGTRGQVRRTYRLRYHAPMLAVFEAGRTVTLADPDSALPTAVVTIAEPAGTRRRWLDVTVEGTT